MLAALTRAFCVAACAGCAAPHAEVVALRASERVIGRAALGGQVVMLTSAPALVAITPDSGEVSRRALAGRDRTAPKLWGLGEVDDALYSVSGFKRLVRLDVSQSGIDARLGMEIARSIGNLVDTQAGMAAQLAVGEPGMPMALAIDQRGHLEEMNAPPRVSFGLARAEESLLHLLTCSVPPRVLCWTPGSNGLLSFDDGGLRSLVTLEAIPRIAPALMLARPGARSIQDALWIDDGLMAVLFQDGDDSGPLLAEFNMAGRMLRRLAPAQPLRVLVAARAGRIIAVTQSGVLIEVSR